MGVVNLKWRKAIAVKGAWFEKPEEDVVWPEAMRLEPVAGLQCNGDIAYGKVLYKAMLAACNSDDLPHNVHSMNVHSGYKKVFIGHQIVQSFVRGTEQVDRFRHDPVYTPKDFFYVKATDFAAWLAAQGEPPSEHIAAWFEAVGAGAGQVAIVTNTTPSDAQAKGKRKPRKTWRDVAWPYMIGIFKAGQYTTAKDLFNALEKKAGNDPSPFDKGAGPNLYKLVVRETSTPVSLKTIQNIWAEIQDSP